MVVFLHIYVVTAVWLLGSLPLKLSLAVVTVVIFMRGNVCLGDWLPKSSRKVVESILGLVFVDWYLQDVEVDQDESPFDFIGAQPRLDECIRISPRQESSTSRHGELYI